MKYKRQGSLLTQARCQARVIWALTMRESVTRFGREGLGAFWLIAEPAMFIVGVMAIFTKIEEFPTYSIAEFLAVSYPTVLLWRNGTGRVTKSLEINKALLHHRPIRPVDIFYSRLLLEFAGAAAAFIILFLAFIQLRICHWPADILRMTLGYMMVLWFSFAFVLIMASLAELSETIERISHLLLYLMLPFSGVFVPLFTIPDKYKQILLLFPLVDCVEYFHSGYYGARMQTYYHLRYTIFSLLFMTLFAYTLLQKAIKTFQRNI